MTAQGWEFQGITDRIGYTDPAFIGMTKEEAREYAKTLPWPWQVEITGVEFRGNQGEVVIHFIG